MYRGKNMGDLDPHIYAVAEEAFAKMERYLTFFSVRVKTRICDFSLLIVGIILSFLTHLYATSIAGANFSFRKDMKRKGHFGNKLVLK